MFAKALDRVLFSEVRALNLFLAVSVCQRAIRIYFRELELEITIAN
jgi:hypothetical protein